MASGNFGAVPQCGSLRHLPSLSYEY